MSRAGLIPAFLTVAALAVTAAAAGAPVDPRLAVVDVPRSQVVVCGRERAAHVVPDGTPVAAHITRIASRRGSLTVVRCRDGRWVDPAQIRVPRGGRVALRLATGDYRLRATAAGRPSRFSYVRIGVGEIARIDVGFNVRNLNRTGATCEPFARPDGRDYIVRGHLVGPRTALVAERPTLTVYVHGGFTGEPLWHLQGLPGYDHVTEMARLGQVSVSLDLLGYGRSGLPDGNATCPLADADVLHQVIQKLRAASYAAGPARAPRFHRVALAGLSFGGIRAVAEAAAFADIDALVQMATLSPAVLGIPAFYEAIEEPVATCRSGGEPKHAGGPPNYTDYRPQDEPQLYFHDAEPAVMDAVLAAAEKDPCGSLGGGLQTIVFAGAGQPRITIPVLLIFGDHDSAQPSGSADEQRRHYISSHDVTALELDDTGHLVMFERTAPAFRAKLSDWLRKRGF